MIKNTQPLSLPEVKELIKDKEKDELEKFIKKFSKMSGQDADEIRKRLKQLELLKMKDKHIVKIIDLLPKDASDLNKIFVDIGLDGNEVDKILEVVKKYK